MTTPPLAVKEEMEAGARKLFETDWPKDDWDRFQPNAEARQRYRRMFEAAVKLLTEKGEKPNG